MDGRCWAVVVAAGRGRRMGLNINKVFYRLNGRSVLRRSLDALAACPDIEGAVLVLSADDMKEYQALIQSEGASSLVKAIAPGGETRQQSVLSGLRLVPPEIEFVAIHDAARAFAPAEVIEQTISDAKTYSSGVAATYLTDTIKEINAAGEAVFTPDRNAFRVVQTPQVFRLSDILKTHIQAAADGYEATDDAALMEKYHGPVHLSVTQSGLSNRKMTTQEDLRMMTRLTEKQMRVGHGFDAHRLAPGRRLVLCGVEIPWAKGLDGHSDADVAAHALMDAMLGAAGMGDIGRMFPDSDPNTLGISSMILLDKVRDRLKEAGYGLLNCDVTIIAQKPKLASYVDKMRLKLADVLKVDPEQVNVKATTTEHMGYEGRGEGISAHAVVIIGG